MDQDRIATLLEHFQLDAAKREQFARFAEQGARSLEPEVAADFRLDCMTLTENDTESEEQGAELA